MFLGILGIKYCLEEQLLTDWICFCHFAKRWISHVWYVFDKWSTRFGGWKGWVTYGFQKLVKLWNLDPTYVSWVKKTWLLTYNYKLCTTYNLTPNLHSETKKNLRLTLYAKIGFSKQLTTYEKTYT